MNTIEGFLTVLGAEGTNITDTDFLSTISSKYPFDAKKSQEYNEAVAFFMMIDGIHNELMTEKNIQLIIDTYQGSSDPYKKQLIDIMERNQLVGMDILSDTESFFESDDGLDISMKNEFSDLRKACLPVMKFSATLVRAEKISFEQYLTITTSTVRLAQQPNKTNADHLQKLALELPKTGLVGRLAAYLTKAVGTALNSLGFDHGQKMIDEADAKLKIYKSLYELTLFDQKKSENPGIDDSMDLDDDNSIEIK